MGELHVGVRFDDADALARASEAYADRMVDDPQAIDDLGFTLHPPSVNGVRGRAGLRHGGCDLVRSRSTDRLLRVLDTFLALEVRERSSLVRLLGTGALVRNGRAAIVPSSLLDRSAGIERRCEQAGAGIGDEHSVLVDPVAREVVIGDGLVGDAALGIRTPWLAAPGHYPIVALHETARTTPAHGSVGAVAVRLLSRVATDDALTHDAFDGILALASLVSPVEVGATGLSDVDAILAGLGS